MSVPQAACLAIAVLLIEFPVSNGFALMRNADEIRKKCTRRTRSRYTYIAILATIVRRENFQPPIVAVLSYAKRFKRKRRRCTYFVTRYLFHVFYFTRSVKQQRIRLKYFFRTFRYRTVLAARCVTSIYYTFLGFHRKS